MAQTWHQADVEPYWDNIGQRSDGVVVTMNCGEGSQTEESLPNFESKHLPVLVTNLWQQDNGVDIILLQECPTNPSWLNKTIDLLMSQSNREWDRVLEVESNTKRPKANVIIFDANKYKRDTGKNASASSSFDIDIGGGESARRHTYCRLIARDGSNFVMDVLSFHGVENDVSNKGKRSIMNKNQILKDYIRALYKRNETSKIPILIGGDWNIEINPEFVEEPSGSTARVWKPPYVDKSCKRFQRNKIDYFVVFDYWGMHRSEKIVRLLNMLDTAVAKAHTDHRMAANLDHDPVFVPYQTLALVDNLCFLNGKPTFPRSLVSNCLNKETCRLQHDVNVIFPKRCMEQPIMAVTWGQLLEERKDEIVLRYYCHRHDEYFHGSEISPVEEEEWTQQSGIVYGDETISSTSLREYIEKLIQDKQPKRRKNSEILISHIRSLNTKQDKFLSNHVFPKILWYSDGLPTLDAACRILYKILQEKDRIWKKEDMRCYIQKELKSISQERVELILKVFKRLSRDQKVKFLFDVQLLLGYELKGNIIQPKAMTQTNLKSSLGKITLVCLLKKYDMKIGKSTAEEVYQHILTIKNDLSRDSDSLEASTVRAKCSESLQNIQHLVSSDDILHQYTEDPESKVFMLTLAHTRWNATDTAMDDFQLTTPDQSVLKVNHILDSAGETSMENTSSKASNSPGASLRHQDVSGTGRSLEKQFDKVRAGEEGNIHQIIEQGLENIHEEIRKMKNLPQAVMNVGNLRELQRKLKKDNKSLGSLLDERIRDDGISGEYRKFKTKFPGMYAYTSYIMNHLVAEIDYNTGSKKSFLAKAFF